MKLFDKRSDCAIGLPENGTAAISLAAADLQRDLRKISGHTQGFPIAAGYENAAILIRTVPGDSAEAYTIDITDDAVTITGSDTLGTVFGIYAFSTRCLQVLPVWQLVDMFPQPREAMELPAQIITSAPRTIRLRGWFINDEDLLCDFKASGKHRRIDYGYYANVLHMDVLDMVLETALRMEINLVIPGSLADIDNPAEEEMIQAVTRRGLYVSQHHIEPVGVSFFACENYLARRNRTGENLSYYSNPDLMEEIWQYYVNKWAKYGDRVVWQVGLRGKGDTAVWKSDPNFPDSMEARGAIVSKAIRTQQRMIRQALGTRDFTSTVTLWSEVSGLYGDGYLDIPEGTTVVLSDTGHTQMFTENFYSIPRNPIHKYGIYYHTSFWYEGPHLAEGCNLKKMAFSYEEARKMDSLSYSMVNISNLRPVHFSVWFNACLVNAPEGFDGNETLDRLLGALYGQDAGKIRPLLEEYYDTIAVLQTEDLLQRYSLLNVTRHEYGPLDFPEFTATDGYLRFAGIRFKTGKYYAANDRLFVDTMKSSLENWKALYEKMCRVEAQLCPESTAYFRKFLKFETFYMMQLTIWLLNIKTILHSTTESERVQALPVALEALERILEARKVLEQGKWEGWHNGDKKIGIPDLITLTHDAYREGVKKPPKQKHANF